MLSPQQHFLLHGRREVGEVVAVAADSNNQVAVLVGIFLCLKELVTVNDIDLKLKAATGNEHPYKLHQLCQGILLEHFLGELEVHGDPADKLLM